MLTRRMAARRGPGLFQVAFAALLALSGGLALAYRFAPLLDWPEHMAEAAITAHRSDPAWAVARYYDAPPWFSPYHIFRWLQAALGYLFGPLGLRAALLIPLWGGPCLAYALARRFGRDRWVGLAAFTLAVEYNL